MPVTRRRAAVAAVAQEEGRDAAIYISSDSDAGSDPEDSESEEEEDTSDEDFIDVSDSEADDGESSDEEGEEDSESEAEAEAEQLGADRSEVACNKIAGLLSSNILEPLYLSPCNFRTDPQSFKHSQNKEFPVGGRSLEGLKLAEYKVYLKKNGLSQTGGMDTCVDRIVLHWRFKDADPRRIYPRSSFCINCKGDVCRGDAVLFKQKVYEKSGKRHAKCIGNRIVAGKVIKESYGKQKQQHTFTTTLLVSIDSSVLEQRTWEITTFASVACQRAQPIQNDDFSS
ncbi:SAP domain-containing protein, partial [Zea mays]